jgi:hypothetical protein
VVANADSGIRIENGAASTLIGGQYATLPNAGNTIRATVVFGLRRGAGIAVAGGTTGTQILGNAISGNAGVGIDLNDDGANANDGLKPTGSANLGMDSAVITSAGTRGSTLTVSGYVGSAASQSLFAGARVEFFVSDGDASGYGEGAAFLGTLTTDASGNFSGSFAMVPGADRRRLEA